MIGIVNYGVGNIQSLLNALSWCKAEAMVINAPAQMDQVNGILLPGVGAFIPAMEQLEQCGFADPLRHWALVDRKPLMGVCLGMQLLARSSNEGGYRKGLDLVPVDVTRLPQGQDLRVPHVGWNVVRKARDSRLWDGLETACCYFVHSYCMPADEEAGVIGVADHGITFGAMVERGNIMGAQFHPEKSQHDGLKILTNFVKVTQAC